MAHRLLDEQASPPHPARQGPARVRRRLRQRCCCRSICSSSDSVRSQVGIIATATLLGSGLLTLAVGLRAYRFHYRTLLLAATALMAATGLGFAFVTDFWPLLVDRARRHAQSLERRRERVPAARARGALARSSATGSARRCSRATASSARSLAAVGLARRGGRRDASARSRGLSTRRVDPGDVRPLRAARRRSPRSSIAGCRARSTAGAAAPTAPLAEVEEARSTRSRRSSASTRSAAASSCSRWSRCGSTSASTCRSRAAGALFFWTGLLTAVSYLVAVRDRRPHRARQHDGVHAPPVEPVPDR